MKAIWSIFQTNGMYVYLVHKDINGAKAACHFHRIHQRFRPTNDDCEFGVILLYNPPGQIEKPCPMANPVCKARGPQIAGQPHFSGSQEPPFQKARCWAAIRGSNS